MNTELWIGFSITFIGTLVSLYLGLHNGRRLKEIEKDKQTFELRIYRANILRELMQKLTNLQEPLPDIHGKIGDYINSLQLNGQIFQNSLPQILPLLDEDLKQSLIDVLKKPDQELSNIINQFKADRLKRIDASAYDHAYHEAIEKIYSIIGIQIGRLLKI